MKKSTKLNFGVCLAVGLIIAFTGCATLNPKNVEAGKFFDAYYGMYDMLKPLEEQCMLINLSSATGESFLIRGIYSPNLASNDITVLQPGTRTIRWEFYDPSAATGGTYHTGGNTITYDFEPGQYYYFYGERRGSNAYVNINNLNNAENARVSAPFRSKIISSESIIVGINKAIRRGMKYDRTSTIISMAFDKNIPVEQQAMLYVPGLFCKINEFSGRKVKWDNSSIFKLLEVTIPSGQHTVKFESRATSGTPFNNGELTVNFEAGHRYMLDKDGRIKDMTNGY